MHEIRLFLPEGKEFGFQAILPHWNDIIKFKYRGIGRLFASLQENMLSL